MVGEPATSENEQERGRKKRSIAMAEGAGGRGSKNLFSCVYYLL